MKKAFISLNPYKNTALPSYITLGISVGQEYHENHKLKAMIELINSTFRNSRVFVTFAVCDTLQRHSIGAIKGLSDEEARRESIEQGEKWLERNRKILLGLKVPYEFVHWDSWLKRPDFAYFSAKVCGELANNPGFRSAMQESVDSFSKRAIERDPSLDEQSIKVASKNYLIEESAVLMLMWAKDPRYQNLFYPGEMTKVLKVARDIFLSPSDKLEWVRIRFKPLKNSDAVLSVENRRLNQVSLSEQQASELVKGFSLAVGCVYQSENVPEEEKCNLAALYRFVASQVICNGSNNIKPHNTNNSFFSNNGSNEASCHNLARIRRTLTC